MKNRLLVIVAILIALVMSTYAQEFSRVGTSMAQFLKIPAGARGAALGGAYAAASDMQTGRFQFDDQLSTKARRFALLLNEPVNKISDVLF